MMILRRGLLLLVLALAACNLSVPEVTPTVAPTRTPSPAPLITNTPPPTIVAQVASATASSTATLTLTAVPSATFTELPTSTHTQTATVTLTSTNTLTPTASDTNAPTATPTFTASATNTDQPTVTPSLTATATLFPTRTDTPLPSATNTPIPSPTPLPLIPTDTATSTLTPTLTATNAPSSTPTYTPTVTFTPSNTPRPSPTPTRTLSPGELAAFNTPIAPVGQPATPTPPELAQVPTLDATPTFITAEAPLQVTPQVEITVLPINVTPQLVELSPTPQPTVALIVTLPGIVTAAPPITLDFNPPTTENRAFALSTDGGLAGTGFSLLNNTLLFERNPVDPNIYLTTDTNGSLFITGLGGAGAYRPDMSPFSQFVPQTRDENNAYVSAAKWSPNGQYLAFIVAGRKTADDGVWFFTPGQFPPIQLLVDCLPIDVPGCSIVSNPFDPNKWESRELRWSPGSDAILVSLYLHEENRSAVLVLPVTDNTRARDVRPPVYRYDYGDWAVDGSRILVSGHAVDGHVFVGWINRDGSFSELVYDAEANGLWMGFAHQARDGSIFALGSPGNRNGPYEALRIYNMAGQPLTGPIGDGFPQRVEWSPDGRAVFLQTNGRQFLASVDGEVREITGQVAGAQAVNWVSGGLPPGDGGGAPPVIQPTPAGVIEGSLYPPGTQLRIYSTQLNIRSGPGTGYDFVRNFLELGEYVVILAGPVEADSARWWQVQTADGYIGWIAAEIGGVATVGF
ncbi:MAG: SH3 domain-containing protein [Anaerolineae bacterium]